ncbi:DNA-3-methyladenine glycosylase I [Spirochaetia bacterium]|nr:DNA-3-methyladenine glycosylase I [Spirochaetia bacterium]
MERIRCPWCLGDDDYIKYHDKEWGKPLKNSQKLFEFLILDGAQAGLSWLTILKRREGYRAAFDGMDPEIMARYGTKDIARLMGDTRIIRNHRKIESAIANAQAYLTMMEGPVSFSKWLWDWVDGKPLVNHFKTMREVPPLNGTFRTDIQSIKSQGLYLCGPHHSVCLYASRRNGE